MKPKKAEMTTQQIVILIILIIGFAVILFFLFRLNLGQESDKQLCYNSVMNRANKLVPTDSITLNCKRSYVCITKDGSCEQMLEPVKKKVKTQEDVYKVLADELSDCWWMFGEGKINYVGKDLIPELYCSICSQVAFDDSIQALFSTNQIEKRHLYEYMANKKLGSSSQSPTYSEYLYGTNDLNLIPGGKRFGEIVLDGKTQYYILMGITSKVNKLAWMGVIAGGLTLGVFFIPMIAGYSVSIVGALIIGGGTGAAGGYFLSPVLEGSSGNHYVASTMVKVNSEEYAALNCSEITTLS